jgi:hypothetical protein
MTRNQRARQAENLGGLGEAAEPDDLDKLCIVRKRSMRFSD